MHSLLRTDNLFKNISDNVRLQNCVKDNYAYNCTVNLLYTFVINGMGAILEVSICKLIGAVTYQRIKVMDAERTEKMQKMFIR